MKEEEKKKKKEEEEEMMKKKEKKQKKKKKKRRRRMQRIRGDGHHLHTRTLIKCGVISPTPLRLAPIMGYFTNS
jgi:hypothetical protein